jgi:hypothetical protein
MKTIEYMKNENQQKESSFLAEQNNLKTALSTSQRLIAELKS